MKKIAVVGGGISGLSAACYLAKEGHKVTVYEKNKSVGGRARVLEKDGFVFDIGPTFYWMPDIFEKFFNDFNQKAGDFYNLVRLNPGYEIFYSPGNSIKVSENLNEIYGAFEQREPGSSNFLKKLLKQAEYNYKVAIEKVMEKPGKSPLELVMPETVANVTEFMRSISSSVRANIKNEELRQVLEFPVLFLGAKPSSTPQFYSFMNYADMVLGTWYIMGGFYKLIEAMESIAKGYGAEIVTEAHVDKILVSEKSSKATGIAYTNTKNGQTAEENVDFVIASADYHFAETLLDKKYRNYSEEYWQKRVFAPSALLFYVGFDTKLKNISHHTLFFDSDFTYHAKTIYDKPDWPEKPLFYGSFPSVTDPAVAPEGKECGIFLIPIATGLKEDDNLRQHYFTQIIDRMESLTGQKIYEHILFMESYSVKDFVNDYHAYKGNAYGLSNILTQTAFLKPKMENRHIGNLLYAGQLTIPGPGVPPAIISGKIASGIANNKLKNG